MEELLIASVDGLPGFKEAIKATYPNTVQRCIVHQIRKVSRSKVIFSTDDSLQKVLYLTSKSMLKKWTQKIRGWEKILRMLVVVYPEKMDKYLI